MKGARVLFLIMTAISLTACGAEGRMSGTSMDDVANANAVRATQVEGRQPGTDGDAQREEPVEEVGVRIKAVVSRNCNYVYHMLAVSGCGYANEYGDAYQAIHPKADLQTLKGYEEHITVVGGEHEGSLYFLCVALPASLDDGLPVSEYYEALADLFGTGEVERNFEAYREVYERSFSEVAEVSLDSFRDFYSANKAMGNEIAGIASVMHRNYDIYVGKVWESSYEELSAVASGLNKELAKIDYASRWEEVLGCKYRQDEFLAVMCNSMENGPNCINISNRKDVFYHSGQYAATAKLISHEFGIYLLMDLLADTEAFWDNSYFSLVEALAEYYNTVVSGGHSDWDWGDEYISFYRQLGEEEPDMTAEEMFLRAVDYFMPESAES